jgi:hypothetical protein
MALPGRATFKKNYTNLNFLLVNAFTRRCRRRKSSWLARSKCEGGSATGVTKVVFIVSSDYLKGREMGQGVFESDVDNTSAVTATGKNGANAIIANSDL